MKWRKGSQVATFSFECNLNTSMNTMYTEWFAQLAQIIEDNINEVEARFTPKDPIKMDEGGHSSREGWIQTHKVIRGNVFEKGTVNYSCVTGEFDPRFAKEIPGTTDKNRQYYATGISVVLHPTNPWVPAMHFNTRYLKTHEKEWFGGGMDLTPCLDNETFKIGYHRELKKVCDLYDATWYDKFSKACDEYFYLPHRKETRGIGGLFFEYYDPKDMDFKFVERLGIKFADVMRTTAINYMNNNYTDEHKDIQKIKRGRYVEFNLLYDRGTKFGFKTGGNMEAILMSLPPDVSWP